MILHDETAHIVIAVPIGVIVTILVIVVRDLGIVPMLVARPTGVNDPKAIIRVALQD